MVAYVHIEYSACQFSEESNGGGWNPPHPGPCGTEISVDLRGLNSTCGAEYRSIPTGMLLLRTKATKDRSCEREVVHVSVEPRILEK